MVEVVEGRQTDEDNYIKGTPYRVIFKNDDNAYTVMRVKVEETNEDLDDKDIAVIGHFPVIHMHESYHFTGTIQVHPRYGKQYEVQYYKKLLPESEEGMIQYLSGDLFPGIGQKTAESIIHTLGENAVSKIIDSPECLNDVPKLPDDKAKQLYNTLMEHQGLERIMLTLSKYGFGPQLSMKIYQTYGNETVEIINDNPYCLVHDVDGIGFQRSDELAQSLGMDRDHPNRIHAAMIYLLTEEAMNNGHVFLPIDDIIEATLKLLNQPTPIINEGQVMQEIDVLEEEGKLVIEDEHIYLPSLYFAEKGVVTSISHLAEEPSPQAEFSETEFLEALGSLEERLDIQYAPSQRKAIQTALASPVMLLTGGPGTGKTTVIKGMVEVYAELNGLSLNLKDYKDDEDYPFILIAPTGRAAKRMGESTGLPAVTIHRLLGWKGEAGFDHDDENPIAGRLLIIDEMSMVDLWLTNQLFKSLPDNIQVVIVGDEDQLPSVGPGQVLKDFLDAEVIPTVRLTDIYRQEDGSSIIELAHHIKDGLIPETLTQPQIDRRFFKCRQRDIIDAICQVCENAVSKGYAPRDIQVLAPIYKGNAGIDAINQALQDLFNPDSDDKKTITYGDKVYRVGDKVLQLMNEPESNVFNGDIGEIVAIIKAKETKDKIERVVVSFDGNEVSYVKKDLNQLTLAYCCSIHKSQGSEFPIVVLPIVKGYHRMLKRNIIYTAVTRSRSYLIICGDSSAFEQAINRSDVDRRHTVLADKLVERLQEETTHIEDVAEPELTSGQKTDGYD
ncbi:SF1B family DNA helicase RecD2 [Tuberibacillus sp. Marseille-P3662]|uniref:SF1B family DNA helicase RecD2 n=1 Tax=Tuberibacillus sp. Marseille-P3662 TaxID=1965358 RepID=UPI000A1C8E62|nr:ATP-dependent RecD-like DNA helicase [Tuberibacillus sp. Marseille-P3662]